MEAKTSKIFCTGILTAFQNFNRDAYMSRAADGSALNDFDLLRVVVWRSTRCD